MSPRWFEGQLVAIIMSSILLTTAVTSTAVESAEPPSAGRPTTEDRFSKPQLDFVMDFLGAHKEDLAKRLAEAAIPSVANPSLARQMAAASPKYQHASSGFGQANNNEQWRPTLPTFEQTIQAPSPLYHVRPVAPEYTMEGAMDDIQQFEQSQQPQYQYARKRYASPPVGSVQNNYQFPFMMNGQPKKEDEQNVVKPKVSRTPVADDGPFETALGLAGANKPQQNLQLQESQLQNRQVGAVIAEAKPNVTEETTTAASGDKQNPPTTPAQPPTVLNWQQEPVSKPNGLFQDFSGGYRPPFVEFGQDPFSVLDNLYFGGPNARPFQKAPEPPYAKLADLPTTPAAQTHLPTATAAQAAPTITPGSKQPSGESKETSGTFTERTPSITTPLAMTSPTAVLIPSTLPTTIPITQPPQVEGPKPTTIEVFGSSAQIVMMSSTPTTPTSTVAPTTVTTTTAENSTTATTRTPGPPEVVTKQEKVDSTERFSQCGDFDSLLDFLLNPRRHNYAACFLRLNNGLPPNVQEVILNAARGGFMPAGPDVGGFLQLPQPAKAPNANTQVASQDGKGKVEIPGMKFKRSLDEVHRTKRIRRQVNNRGRRMTYGPSFLPFFPGCSCARCMFPSAAFPTGGAGLASYLARPSQVAPRSVGTSGSMMHQTTATGAHNMAQKQQAETPSGAGQAFPLQNAMVASALPGAMPGTMPRFPVDGNLVHTNMPPHPQLPPMPSSFSRRASHEAPAWWWLDPQEQHQQQAAVPRYHPSCCTCGHPAAPPPGTPSSYYQYIPTPPAPGPAPFPTNGPFGMIHRYGGLPVDVEEEMNNEGNSFTDNGPGGNRNDEDPSAPGGAKP